MVSPKTLVVLCCVLAGVLAGEKYTDKYDHMNIDEVITNDRLYNAYYDCLMKNGKCTPDGKELSENLQEVFDTGCSKCTDAQTKAAVKLIKHMMSEKKEHWEKVCAKYDHNGMWRKFYEEHNKE